jgi:hypothetical protein
MIRNFGAVLLMTCAVLGTGIGTSRPVALAGETVYLQPGQCVMVGSQQVCALKSDVKDGKGDAAAASPAPGDVNYVCRYGEHKGGDLPGYRTYGLVKVTTRADGKFSEILIKDFGIKGKEKCEQAAEDRRK